MRRDEINLNPPLKKGDFHVQIPWVDGFGTQVSISYGLGMTVSLWPLLGALLRPPALLEVMTQDMGLLRFLSGAVLERRQGELDL